MNLETSSHRLVSFSEARTRLGDVGRTTIYELIRHGHLKKVKIGRRGLISEKSIEEYIERLITGGDVRPGGESLGPSDTPGGAR